MAAEGVRLRSGPRGQAHSPDTLSGRRGLSERARQSAPLINDGGMTWTPTLATIEPFVRAVSEQFALAPRRDVAVSALIGSTNRLWRFDVGAESFVVKELSHDSIDQIGRRRRAASFERAVYEAGSLVMAEPLFDRDGQIVTEVVGSRGEPSLVRVHRWIAGETPDVTPAVARRAGEALAVIHGCGRAWSTRPSASLRWWDQDPLAVTTRLEDSPLRDIAGTAEVLIKRALVVVRDAEAIEGEWIYSHADHKPQNSLEGSAGLAVLDWDECGYCHPRLEAVESALRWSVVAPEPAVCFRAFLDGYGELAPLEERDFGKWVAALLGWFSFQARRTLGDWPTETTFDRLEAERMARSTIEELELALASLAVWSSWV